MSRAFAWSALISVVTTVLLSLVGGLNGLAIAAVIAGILVPSLGIVLLVMVMVLPTFHPDTRNAWWIVVAGWLLASVLGAVGASIFVGLPFHLNSDLPVVLTWLVMFVPNVLVGILSGVVVYRRYAKRP